MSQNIHIKKPKQYRRHSRYTLWVLKTRWAGDKCQPRGTYRICCCLLTYMFYVYVCFRLLCVVWHGTISIRKYIPAKATPGTQEYRSHVFVCLPWVGWKLGESRPFKCNSRLMEDAQLVNERKGIKDNTDDTTGPPHNCPTTIKKTSHTRHKALPSEYRNLRQTN